MQAVIFYRKELGPESRMVKPCQALHLSFSEGNLDKNPLYRLTAKIIPWNLGPLPELSLLWEIPIYLRVPVLGGWTLDSVPMRTCYISPSNTTK